MYCDVIWSSSFLPLNTLFIFFVATPIQSRDLLLLLLIGVWSLRLTLLLLQRIHSKKEDPRYASLMKEWKDKANRNLACLFGIQTILSTTLSLPFYLSFISSNKSWMIYHSAAAALFCIGLTIEVLSDLALLKYKRIGKTDKPCQIGLWNYSRHPNYFGEWVIWIGFAVFSLGESYGYLSLLSPLLMLAFLYKITGIPITEERLTARLGDSYREYQKTTSMFIPWPKKK